MRGWEEPDEVGIEWAEDKDRRKGFVCKVFMITGGMLMVSAAIITLPLFNDSIQEFFVYYQLPIGIVAVVFSTISILALTCCYKARHVFPINLILLIILTISYGLIAAMVSCRYNTLVVLLSFATTVLIVLVVGILAKWGPLDVTGCSWLMCGLSVGLTIAVTAAVIVRLFVYIPFLQLIISCVVVAVYILFLLFDMQMIIGGRREELSEDEYILGAVLLFKDIIILFMYLMEIMNAIMGRN